MEKEDRCNLPEEIFKLIFEYCNPRDIFYITSLSKELYKLRNKSITKAFRKAVENDLLIKGYNLSTFFPERKQYQYHLTGSIMVKAITSLPFDTKDVDIFYIPSFEDYSQNNYPRELSVFNPRHVFAEGYKTNFILYRVEEKEGQSIIDIVQYPRVEQRRHFDISICESYFDGKYWVVNDSRINFDSMSNINESCIASRMEKYYKRGIRFVNMSERLASYIKYFD